MISKLSMHLSANVDYIMATQIYKFYLCPLANDHYIMPTIQNDKTGRTFSSELSSGTPTMNFEDAPVSSSLAIRQKQGPACKEVLDTPELLENILSFLSFRNTFEVVRVSKKFKIAIESSPTISAKLFLRPRAVPSSDDVTRQRIVPHAGTCDENMRKEFFKGLKVEDYRLIRLNPRLEDCFHILQPPQRGTYVRFVLEDYVPRDPQSGKWSRWPKYFMNSRLTDPLCHAITVDIKFVYEYVPAGESAKATICAHVHGFEKPAEAGCTIHDLLRSAFALKGGVSSIRQSGSPDSKLAGWVSFYTFEGRNIRDKSLEELLNILRMHGKEHAVGLLSRRTHVDLFLHEVDVQRPQEEAAEASPSQSPP